MQIRTMTLMARLLVVFTMMGAAQAVASDVQTEDNDAGFHAGDIMVRGRALTVLPTVDNGPVSVIGGNVNASTSVEPEADISYFFTPNISAEAIAAITRHHITDENSKLGNVDLGRVTLLPPTVTAQYHFLPTDLVNPYLGAGVNYTAFLDHELPAGGAVTSIHYDNGFHTAIQAGADFHLQGNWYANLDVKHIFLTTHAKINGGAIGGDVSIDPTIVGLGLGYKF